MRIRFALIGVLALIVLSSIVTIAISRVLLKEKRKQIPPFMSVLMALGACLSLGIVSYLGYGFVQSKQADFQPPHIVKIDNQHIVTYANAVERLVLPMAYDTIESTHPSVVNFPESWQGFKFWMAITAYPKGDAVKENPHILSSNDLIAWQAPKAGLNPLDEPQSAEFEENQRPKQYDSDTHLLYNPDEKRLEVFWRYVDDIAQTFTIYRMTSGDGQRWTDKEVVYSEGRKQHDWLSPAFVYEDKGYKVWYVDRDFEIYSRESQDGLSWSEATKLKVPYANQKQHLRHWHLDVQKIDERYEMLVVGFNQVGDTPALRERHLMNLYHSTSTDNQKWSPLEPIIYPSQKKDRWDGKGIYRSALIKEGATYYVFYSGIGFNDTRGTGIAYGSDLNELKGLDYSDTSDFYPH